MKATREQLPPRAEMVRAMLERDHAYEGVFFTAVRTTRIFCRPTCAARKPYPENVDFYASAIEALAAGFRPCQRCRPLQIASSTPAWIRSALTTIEATPERRWTDEHLSELGLDPVRVRRWFKQAFGMTFHTYLRTRRLGRALEHLAAGASIDDTALDLGYESLSGFRDAFRKTFGITPGESGTVQHLVFARIDTPLGPMLGMAETRGLVLLEFTDRPALPREIEELRDRFDYSVAPGRNSHLEQVEAELGSYFAGTSSTFRVPTHTPGSAFDLMVWHRLQTIPFGSRCTYGDLARLLGKPGGARAVGAANGRNRIAIVIPCHRVCGSDGELTGYGGGQPRKQWLLDHERRIANYSNRKRLQNLEEIAR